jgi:DNA-binding PadR family transcriptional regulator
VPELPSNGLNDLGRFTEQALLILVSLSDGPKHGYAIIEDVQALTGQRLGAGTLYGAIARLESRQLIVALEPSGRRRPYRLSGAGAQVLKERLDALSAVVDTGKKRLREHSGALPS